MNPMNRTEAINLLTHYLRTAFEAADLTWNSDNDAEIETLVTALVSIADESASEAVRLHQENAPHIYPDGSQG